MKVLSKIAHPFVWILTRTTNHFIKIFNIELALEANVTEEEIKTVIQEATSGGHIQKIEQRIVERVFILGDKKISSLMTPRSDLVFMNVMDGFSQVKDTISKHPHRIYPVFKNDKDNVIGVVFLKDLFIAGENDFNLKTCLKPAHFQLESTSAYYDIITVAGLILEVLKRTPKVGEKVHWNGLILEV